MPQIRTEHFLRPWFIATILCFIYVWILINTYDDPLRIVTIGGRFAPVELQPHIYSDEGYDGQFTYYIARYGLDAIPYLDQPAYRLQRILLPFLGSLAAGGNPNNLAWMLLFINLGAMAVASFVLERLLYEFGVSRGYAWGFVLSAGIFGAARLATTEPLAYGLALIAIYCLKHERLRLGTFAFALAVLAKETTIIFISAYALLYLRRAKWGRALYVGFLSLFPWLWWQLILFTEFEQFGVGSGGTGATPFEIIPFGGFIRILTEGSVEAFALLGPLLGIFVIIPTLWGLQRCIYDLVGVIQPPDSTAPNRRHWDIWTTLLFVNCATMLFVPFSTYRELLGILRFIVGLEIAIILYAASRKKEGTLMFSTLWFLTSIIVIASDFSMPR